SQYASSSERSKEVGFSPLGRIKRSRLGTQRTDSDQAHCARPKKIFSVRSPDFTGQERCPIVPGGRKSHNWHVLCNWIYGRSNECKGSLANLSDRTALISGLIRLRLQPNNGRQDKCLLRVPSRSGSSKS